MKMEYTLIELMMRLTIDSQHLININQENCFYILIED